MGVIGSTCTALPVHHCTLDADTEVALAHAVVHEEEEREEKYLRHEEDAEPDREQHPGVGWRDAHGSCD
jgi:hypothetical protein